MNQACERHAKELTKSNPRICKPKYCMFCRMERVFNGV